MDRPSWSPHIIDRNWHGCKISWILSGDTIIQISGHDFTHFPAFDLSAPWRAPNTSWGSSAWALTTWGSSSFSTWAHSKLRLSAGAEKFRSSSEKQEFKGTIKLLFLGVGGSTCSVNWWCRAPHGNHWNHEEVFENLVQCFHHVCHRHHKQLVVVASGVHCVTIQCPQPLQSQLLFVYEYPLFRQAPQACLGQHSSQT